MDHLSDLSDAIAGLQDVLSSMGASIRLTGIEIDDERGGEVFDFLLRLRLGCILTRGATPEYERC